jgi:hypothetical protein
MQRTQTGWLSRLARVNPTIAFVATLVLVLVALFAPGIIGGGLLLLLAAALAAVTATTWPVQPPQTRALRLLLLTVLVAIALAKIM